MNEENERKFKEKLKEKNIINISNNMYNDMKSKIKGLLLFNDEVLDTIDVRILTDKYDDLAVLLNMIVVYPDIQDKIIALGQNEYKIFVSLVKGMNNAGIDWVTMAEDLLDNLNSPNYSKLFKDPEMIENADKLYRKYGQNDFVKVEFEDIDELEQIAGIFTNGNLFNIESYEDLMNLDRNKEYFDLLIGNKENGYISNLTNEDKIRHIILLRKYGHGLDVAELIAKRYFDDFENIIRSIDYQDEKEVRKYVIQTRGLTDYKKIESEVRRIQKENAVIKCYLKAVKEILEENDINKLRSYYFFSKVTKRNHMYRIDSYLRKFFCREKNKTLYQKKDEDKVIIDSREVYLIQDDFKISMTSLDSYSKALDLDVKKVENHGLCTSLLANNNLNHAPIRGACLGFRDYYEQSLYASSPWDLASDRFTKNLNISRASVKARDDKFHGKVDIKFFTPDAQINMIRRRSSEDVFERRELDNDKIDYENEKFKKQPAYVVYFSEEPISNYLNGESKQILTSENLRELLDVNKLNNLKYRTGLVESYAKNDTKWRMSKEEADKREVDIVIVDRTYTVLKERVKLDELEKQILDYDINKINSSLEEKNKFFGLIEKLIVESENCRAGLSIIGDEEDGELNGKLIHEELREKLFSKEIMADRLHKIEAKVANLDIDQQQDFYNMFLEITRNEIMKYEHDVAYFEYDPGYDLKDYMIKYMAKISGKESFSIQNVLNEVDSSTGKSGGQIVCEAIADTRELDEYPSSMAEIHGQKHINNVILFSYLIAKGENTLDHEGIDLLIQSAKFHDVGRDGNWNGLGDGNRHDKDEIPHADPGALGAEFYMLKEKKSDGSNKYSKEQIAIVQTAISYHEVHEKRQNVFDERRFDYLCKKYGVAEKDKEKAKYICIYLKDADAVDRTRFMEDYESDREKISDYERYKRRFWDGLNISYLRTNTSLLLIEDARAIHKELMKRGCEKVYDKDGKYLGDDHIPDTEIISMLEPYKDVMIRRKAKYKEASRIVNISKIQSFLKQKKKEIYDKEQKELMEICGSLGKSELLQLRKSCKIVLDKFKEKDDKEK
ncbi:MAG: hypothetical protein IJH12_08290 [Clostridia bacterium]|nr:hypothetical protein [Clostridia bacterium]